MARTICNTITKYENLDTINNTIFEVALFQIKCTPFIIKVFQCEAIASRSNPKLNYQGFFCSFVQLENLYTFNAIHLKISIKFQLCEMMNDGSEILMEISSIYKAKERNDQCVRNGQGSC
jgi:hypothetical protein